MNAPHEISSYAQRLTNREPEYHRKLAEKAASLIGLEAYETGSEVPEFEPTPEELIVFARKYFLLDTFMEANPNLAEYDAAHQITLNPHPDNLVGDIPPFFYYGTFVTGSRDDVSKKTKPGTITEEVTLPDAAMAVLHPRSFNTGAERTVQDVAIRHYRYITKDKDRNAWPQIIPGPTARKISGNQDLGKEGLVGLLAYPAADKNTGETDAKLFDRLMAEEYVIEQSYTCQPVKVIKQDGTSEVAMCFMPHLAQPPILENFVEERDWRDSSRIILNNL